MVVLTGIVLHRKTEMPEDKSAIGNKKKTLQQIPKENLHLLLDTIESINRSVEYKSILSESMEAIRIVMDAEASSLMLLDHKTGELHVSIPTGVVKNEIKGIKIPKHKGIGGWVVKNAKPYISNNVNESEVFYGDLSDEFVTRNLICVPLLDEKKDVQGVLQAVNRRGGKDFNTRDIPVFQALASHISLAVQRGKHIAQLNNLAKERETHLKETHHRIKNNFQVIIALMDLKIPEIEDPKSIELLTDMKARIKSMAEIHEMLCEQDGFREVNLEIYLKQLTAKIDHLMGRMFSRPNISFKSEEVMVSAEKALLCGIVLNELLLNVYKHAFIGRDEPGKVEIGIRKINGKAEILVTDNGIGLPEDFGTGKGRSIGMWIVRDMIKKLSGTIDILEDSGVRCMIRFPII